MMKKGLALRILILLVNTAVIWTFNIDTTKTWSYAIENSLFGQKVMEHSDGTKNWILVTSPSQSIENRIFGGVYRCEVIPKQTNCKCEKLDSAREKYLQKEYAWPSASLARNSNSVLTCVQHKSVPFRSMTGELNGQCSLFTVGLQNSTSINLSKIVEEGLSSRNRNNNNGNGDDIESRATFSRFGAINQINDAYGNFNNNNNVGGDDDDDESRTEIAIVLDGSGSIEAEDFQRAKDFIYNMMKTFWAKCLECEFAVVQYGTQIRTEFDLRQSQNSQAALRKVQDIKQLYNMTKTASAIQHVMDSIFIEQHGSKKNAKKIIIVLTDGVTFMDERNLTTVISSTQMMNIERYVIGVGNAFSSSKAMVELQLIASDPDDKHLFRVTNYSALDGLLSALQQKLVGIEGTKGDVLQFELAEMGFSSQILNQSLLFGAVGAFDWSGGLLRYSREKAEDTYEVAFLNETSKDAYSAKYSYLGYSLALMQGRPKNKEPLYVSGAPRHSNTGKVLVFEKDVHSYHLIRRFPGEQVGSYFGSELCPLDVDMDGLTDYLLIGAPFYHIKGEEGRVYVYKFDHQDRFTSVKSLSGQLGYTFARFGFAIASVSDINRDGYADIAIGAPMEVDSDDHSSSGSVYIYNGCSNGILEPWSQRIRAKEVSKGLQFFGQSIASGLDFTGDGYVDITIGALGHMLVLRSRPVVRFTVTARFTPPQVPIMSDHKTVDVQLCFKIESVFENMETQKSRIVYTMDLDIGMMQKRIMFEGTNEPRHTSEILIEHQCASHKLMVLPCKYDCFTSINISVSYSLTVDQMRDLPAPVLDKYTTTQRYFELPYMKDCNNKAVCVAELSLYTGFSEKELVVGDTKNLLMNLSLVNNADNSYLTTLRLTYPRNLQVKKILEPSVSSPSVKCAEPSLETSLLSSVSCKIGYPIFRKSAVNFAITWQLDEALFPGNFAAFDVNVTSVNEGAIPLTQAKRLPVKHSFTAVLSRPRPVIEVNISQAMNKSREIQYEFNINGENQYGAQLELTIWIPVMIKGIKVTVLKKVQPTQTSTQCNMTDETISRSDKSNDLSPCNTDICQAVKCAIMISKEDIIVHAELNLEALQQVVEEKLDLVVSAEINYNPSLYAALKLSNLKETITVMLLKDRIFLTLPLIIGSAAGGLLLLALIVIIMWKCGFFKRTYKDLRE
ncbi:integrin alpha-E isoform X2 [Pleurodeles waltl]|uniref:integrin alpha-E isoform X2 n=1 Tax=Pleurodeles waltl TaxID=8319 RepID=UPI003709AE8F